MSATSLDRIGVQTARMLEIYSLVRRELAKGRDSPLSTQEREGLNRAIETIAQSMRQLQAHFAPRAEQSSATEALDQPGNGVNRHRPESVQNEAKELDQLVDEVLKWQMSVEERE